MPANPGVYNGGAPIRGLVTLPATTEMLTVDAAGNMSRQAIPIASFAALTGSPSDNAVLASALAAKVNLSGDTMTGKLRVPAGSYFTPGLEVGSSVGMYDSSGLVVSYNGQECLQLNQSELSLRSSQEIGWTGTTSATGVIDSKFVRNNVGQADFRGDSGFRIRNLANSAAANLNCASVACTEIDFGFNLGFPRKITPQSYGVLIPANSTWEGSFTTGNNRVTLSSGISFWFNTAGGDDASIHRVGTGYDNANLDIRAKNGLRIRDMNNTAFAALQAQRGTFGDGPSTNGGAWVVDPVNTNLRWDQFGINYLTLQGRGDAQSLSFVNPSVAPFVGRGQMDGANRVGFYFNPTSISAGAVSGYTSTPVTLSVAGKISASHGTLTASDPALNITQTWNSGAVAFNSVDVNVTRTAAAIQSTFATFRRGGANQIVLFDSWDNVAQAPAIQIDSGIIQGAVGGHVALGTTGDPGIVGLGNGLGLIMHPSRYIGWGSTGNAVRNNGSAWADIKLARNGTGPALMVQAAGGLQVLGTNGVGNAPITAGAITTDGRFTSTSDFNVVVPSSLSTRETIFRARVSDAGNDAFHIYNATSVDGSFAPGFSGSRFSSNLFAMAFIAQTDAANDTGTNPLMIFEARRTTSQTDPNNGTLSPITTRPPFSWQSSTTEYMRMFANGNLALNSTTDNGAKLQVNGAITSGADSWIGFAGRSLIASPQDSIIQLSNAAQNSFGMLRLGGSSSSFPAIKRNGTAVNFRLADDSADANIMAAQGLFSGYLTHGFQTLTANPTTSDITSGLVRVVKNSTNGELRLWANDGGTMKSVLLS